MHLIYRNLCVTLLLSTCLAYLTPDAEGQSAAKSNLRAGVAKVDITPAEVNELEVGGHRRKVTGVRDPLRA